MRNLFFSIIVPIYRVEKTYLTKCLHSLVSQSYNHLEVILVCDGCSDELIKICREYKIRDHRIKVLFQENRGVSAARNKGIETAKGDWILFVDADDWINSDTCERLSSIIDNHNDCDVILFRAVKNFEAEEECFNYGLEERAYL